jgi:hypothetical protein
MSATSQHPYVQFEGTKVWQIIDAELSALVKNGDVIEQTDRRYIIGSFCKALATEEAATSDLETNG